MKRIYVASKNIPRAQSVMSALRDNDYAISLDWTIDYEETNHPEKALAEREAIRGSDALVYLYESDAESAKYELGMALGIGLPVIASAPPAFFLTLPEVTLVRSDDEIVAALRGITS